jgi:signal transduction histidine kinase
VSHTISDVRAVVSDTPTVHLTPVARWLGLGALALFAVIGFVVRVPHDPAGATVGMLLTLIAGIPCFLDRARFAYRTAGYAVASGAGLAICASGDSRDVAWFGLCVLLAWCTVAGGLRVGAAYASASLLVFGGEALFAVRDPGWAAWAAGTIFTFAAAVLVRQQLVLVERLHAAQADLAERSRAEERARIARELHDVIAHSLTVSLLHISAARLAVEEDPAQATRALAEAERLGRQSLDEVRAAVGITSAVAGTTPTTGTAAAGIAAPVAGLGDLDRLVGGLRAAGLDVELSIDGRLDAIAAVIGSTVYRIVQEALTNAAKHAFGSAVAVRAVAGKDNLDVTIDSSGRPGHGQGLGLISMRERAEAVGGTCTAGPGGHGWLVHACLPRRAQVNARAR